MVAFQGGSRPQQITAITLRLAMEQQGQKGEAARTEDVVRSHPISSGFESTPNSVREFPFDVQLAADECAVR